MSWKPDIWIEKGDFKNHEDELKIYDIWEFNIAGIDGYILKAEDTSSAHEELHDIIKDVPHWLLNGEGAGCNNCWTWGNQIYECDH